MWYAWEDEKCIQNFVRKPERKRLIGKPRREWKGRDAYGSG
jgi:hypothetical protein